ncbi:DeoR family transcriptional regulator [Phenylobacterium sp.]|uniref:DeoR family transcriptional regulator n=1 Tax=Phenylobacterium sp. TaxID=1871053 RepID=UPI002DEF9623|nr:DeoR family transcriptional regulator [Phenylobacterium sp.]
MAALPDGAKPDDLRHAPDRRATLLSVAFIVDQANISRAGGDFLEPLVSAAIVQANLAGLRHDPELQRRYGNSGDALPDSARRPISIHAVAESLRLPYETVRRRVHQLIDGDLCVMTPAGAYIPRAAIVGARHAAIQAARMQRIVQLHTALMAAGFLPPPEPATPDLAAAPVRAANTALAHYMLRTCERLVELVGDVVDGFILLGLVAANTERQLGVAPGVHPRGLLARRSPCSGSDLARRLGMAGETVRRRLPVLAAAGFARRVRGGWLVAAPPARQTEIVRAVAENQAELRRLFSRLRELAAANAAPRSVT